MSIVKTLFSVVFAFAVSNVPSAIIAFYFITTGNENDVVRKVYYFGFLASSINSAVNFVIYCLLCKKFRTSLLRPLGIFWDVCLEKKRNLKSNIRIPSNVKTR